MNNCVTFYVSNVQKLAIGIIPKDSSDQIFCIKKHARG